MAANDPVPLFLSAEEPEPRGIGISGHRAVMASGILLLTGAAIVLTIVFAGNPIVLFGNAMASVVGTSAPQDGTAPSMPIIQSTAESRSTPTTSDASTNDEIAGAVKTASETEIRVRAEALFREFHAWAVEKDTRVQVQQVEPIQPPEAMQDARVQDDVQNARAEVRPAPKNRHARSKPETRTQTRAEKNARAHVRTERQAREPRSRHHAQPVHHERVQVRPEQPGQTTVTRDGSGENTWASWSDRVFGWLR